MLQLIKWKHQVSFDIFLVYRLFVCLFVCLFVNVVYVLYFILMQILTANCEKQQRPLGFLN